MLVESVGKTSLHFYMQRRVLAEVGHTAAGLVEFDPAAGASGYTQSNWRLELSNGITFLGDSLGSGGATAVWIALAVVLAMLLATCWLAGNTSPRQSPPAAD